MANRIKFYKTDWLLNSWKVRLHIFRIGCWIIWTRYLFWNGLLSCVPLKQGYSRYSLNEWFKNKCLAQIIQQPIPKLRILNFYKFSNQSDWQQKLITNKKTRLLKLNWFTMFPLGHTVISPDQTFKKWGLYNFAF